MGFTGLRQRTKALDAMRHSLSHTLKPTQEGARHQAGTGRLGSATLNLICLFSWSIYSSRGTLPDEDQKIVQADAKLFGGMSKSG
jgi:hypothetical protein